MAASVLSVHTARGARLPATAKGVLRFEQGALPASLINEMHREASGLTAAGSRALHRQRASVPAKPPPSEAPGAWNPLSWPGGSHCSDMRVKPSRDTAHAGRASTLALFVQCVGGCFRHADVRPALAFLHPFRIQ